MIDKFLHTQKQIIIGITGSIGSGKTTVAKLFSRHWYNRIDADEIGHEILRKNSVAYKKIIKEFGNKLLDKNMNINRNKLGDIVFNDNAKLKKLNSITHPIILKEIKNQIKKIKEKCSDTSENQRFSGHTKSKGFCRESRIVIDAPLLLETKAKNLVDKIVVVKCDKRKIFDRLSQKFSKQEIEKILKSQMPLNEKLKYADFVIDNNENLHRLNKQVKKIVHYYKNFSNEV